MALPQTATIFAVSSGRLPAAVAIVRISGPAAADALWELIGKRPEPRQAVLSTIRAGADGEPMDRGLVLWFPGPESATGEDLAELHLHGGRAVVSSVLDYLAGIPGCRPAEAGEFSRRAFENGKLDLTEVEGLADLIAAETEAQRRQAFAQMQGHIGAQVEAWRRRLIDIRARVEAALDFSDEEDVPASDHSALAQALREFRFDIETKLGNAGRGERIRDGLQVVVMGPPNAGKSSLLNALARRDVAIVTEEAGTTRDVLEVHLDLDGYPMIIVDTAGLRETENVVEREGIRRALGRGRAADLVLWLEDATVGAGGPPEDLAQDGAVVWLVSNKIDLIDSQSKQSLQASAYSISATTGSGIEGLTDALTRFAQDHCGSGAESLITRERHRLAFEDCARALSRAETLIDSEPELLAEELRLASDALGRVVGHIDVEDLLDVIFSEFCIGK